MERYFANSREMIRMTLCNDSLAPLQRLGDYIDKNIEHISLNNAQNGCLFGNFAVEASDHSEALRIRVVEILAEVQQCVSYCLHAATSVNELAADTDCDALAQFVVSSLQGAILLAKAQRSPAPVENFRVLLFERVLI